MVDVLEKRLDTLLARMDAEPPLREHGFTREEAATVLADQDGHVGKSLIHLRDCAHSKLKHNQLVLRSAVAWASAPSTRPASPIRIHSNQTEEDSLDELLTQHNNSQSSSRSSSRSMSRCSMSSTWSQKPSLVHFSVYTGRLQHPEIFEAARRQEQQTISRLGPGAYDPALPAKRRTSAPIITPLPSNAPLVCEGGASDTFKPARSSELPAPEFAERLNRAHTYTSALRLSSSLGDSIPLQVSEKLAAESRPTGVSSPRKRSYAPALMDAEATRQSAERLHAGKTQDFSNGSVHD